MHEVVYIAHACVLVLMYVEIRDKILLKGEECKTQEKFNYSEDG